MDEVMNTPFGEVNAAEVEAATAAAAEADGRKNVEEITIKFAKGLASEPFVSKEGKELVRIQIPNADPEDHSPWQEFVLGANQVHENQYGKGLWAKIPADGHTTVLRPFLAGKDENGKNIWDSRKRTVSNRELKEMVEFYKTRGRDERTPASENRKTSVREALAGDKKEADRAKEAKTRTEKKQSKEPEL